MSYFLFLMLIIIVSLLLILVIMVQNPKGGGLSSSFGGAGSQSLGGVQSTTNFLDKSTWTLALTLFALILLSNFSIPRDSDLELKSATDGIVNDREVIDTPPAILDTDQLIDSSN